MFLVPHIPLHVFHYAPFVVIGALSYCSDDHNTRSVVFSKVKYSCDLCVCMCVGLSRSVFMCMYVHEGEYDLDELEVKLPNNHDWLLVRPHTWKRFNKER